MQAGNKQKGTTTLMHPLLNVAFLLLLLLPLLQLHRAEVVPQPKSLSPLPYLPFDPYHTSKAKGVLGSDRELAKTRLSANAVLQGRWHVPKPSKSYYMSMGVVMMGAPDDLGEACGEGGGVRLCSAPTAACAIALL